MVIVTFTIQVEADDRITNSKKDATLSALEDLILREDEYDLYDSEWEEF